MKLERISETQIRCTLTSFDLKIRNLNLGELTYGSEKARSLFSEMMQKAEKELGFDADGIPIMIEAIPLADQSIVLVITKVEDPEEIDTRFSRFSPTPQEGMTAANFLAGLLEGAQELLDRHMQQQNQNAQQQVQQTQQQTPQLPVQQGRDRTFLFRDLDTAIEAAGALHGTFEGKSSLYKDPESGSFYLLVEDDGKDELVFASTCNVLAEYGEPSVRNYSGKSYLNEHYERIIRNSALENLARIAEQ